jgi:hypothetical protein
MADAAATDQQVQDEVPLPESIADTELNGLNPAEDSTESEQVEGDQEETEQEKPDAATEEEAEEAEDGKTSEDEDEEKPEQTEQKPDPTPEDEQKAHNAEMAAKRIAERNRTNYVNQQRAQIREYEQSANMEDVAEQVKVLQANQYIDTVERNRTTLVNENTQAQTMIPEFNPADKDHYNPKLYQRAIDRFNDTYVITDPESNEVLGAQDRNGNNVSLYQYLQQEATDYRDLIGDTQAGAQAKAQKAEAKMRAKAVNPQGGGKNAAANADDSIDSLFEKVKDISLAG